ncbi:MAG TPA: DUF885 domain-containing protein [Pseudolysinimonas sp.]|nr:DUF885 domain-containing protein [Pseudolysinimonas sp.]
MSTEPRVPSARSATAVDAIAEDWVTTLIDLSPDIATWIGVDGRLGEYGDYSPDGHERFRDEAARAYRELSAAHAVDAVDEVTRTDLLAELQLIGESHDAGLHLRDLNVIQSPVQEIREMFDLMPTSTESDWAIISEKLANVPQAMAGYIETLRAGMVSGIVPARRQVVEVAAQARRHADPHGFFSSFAGSARRDDGAEIPASLDEELRSGARVATRAYARLVDFLETELAPVASEQDGVGRDIYSLQSRHFLGATIDLDETYEWGLDELQRMVSEQERVASEILPGGTVEETSAYLDADPSRILHGTAALQRWMQKLSDTAVSELGREHFDIPEPLRQLECLIAPTQDGGIYYTSPSDDFSRPGRMWWSVPEGQTEFSTWRETTTVYHEGVPGHHLQLGQAVFNREQLNTWRRMLAGTSGHAEGWALYAERLMHELGYLDDPADRFGMLDGQRMRAARVVLDIGVHLGKPNLAGTGPWTAHDALEFMRANVSMNDAVIRFEVNRYLGWPGQAPSYKVGQRIWEQIRDAARASEGAAFSMKRFHQRALDLGGVGLDTLKVSLTEPSAAQGSALMS